MPNYLEAFNPSGAVAVNVGNQWALGGGYIVQFQESIGKSRTTFLGPEVASMKFGYDLLKDHFYQAYQPPPSTLLAALVREIQMPTLFWVPITRPTWRSDWL